MDRFLEQLKTDIPTVHCLPNVSLSELTSFRIGGRCRAVIYVSSAEDYCETVARLNQNGIPFKLLGNGTNILAPDEGFEGIILKLKAPADAVTVNAETVTSNAAVSMPLLASYALHNSLMGMEALSGIPGSVGGACAMNAGAYGTEISDIIRSATVVRNGIIEKISLNKADFAYRKSPLAAPNTVVFSAEFVLSADDGHAAERTADFQNRRTAKQPLSLPSAGSVFKRPQGYFAGALIEQCGLKGARVGGACVSEKHAGFIVNDAHATARDVLELIAYIRSTVYERTGVTLEREIKLLSEV